MKNLPRPAIQRWQPLRSGMLNIYRYDDEEFHFERGRLLLRGNNGTGKSRVLALQLPFLLDGEVAPHRLEPDGDEARRADWNLLMGRHPDRLGYTWIEFGRLTDEGERYCTLGCGMHAVEGRSPLDRWFFITRQRVGESLVLQTPSRSPLTRERLVEAIGAEGQVFKTAREYRRAVDNTLFHLGEERYEALVDLLIQLRQPQLSRKLDEQKLTQALTRALPHLKESMLSDVAESFRSLESDRNALDGFRAAGVAVGDFLKEYRRYVQIATLRRTRAVRITHNAYENAQRILRETTEQRDRNADDLRLTDVQREELATRIASAQQVIDTLKDSPEMRSARALEDARRQADDLGSDARRARHERAAADDALAVAAEEHGQAADECTAAERQAAESRTDVERSADVLRLGADVPPLGELATGAIDALRQELDRRRAQVRHLSTRIGEAGAARDRHGVAHRIQVDLENQVADARTRQHEARQQLTTARDDLSDAVARWAGGLRELDLGDVSALRDALLDWADASASGPSPLAQVADAARAKAFQTVAMERSLVQRGVDDARTESVRLIAERDALAAGRPIPPTPPPTRSVTEREHRTGAPLYMLVDFVPELGADERAGLEAALESSGLLDAWVSPEGRLLPEGHLDSVLVPGRSPQPPHERSLARALVPVADAQVPVATVQAVLEHIGWGRSAGHVWMASDGAWQLGPLHGAWRKSEALHIGHATRERARRQRLEALALEIEAVEVTLQALGAQLRALDIREQTAGEEAGRRPDDTPVRDARAQVDTETRILRERVDRLTVAEQATEAARQALEQAVRRRDDDARDLRLVEWVEKMDELQAELSTCDRVLAVLRTTLTGYHGARKNEDRCHRRRDAAQAALAAAGDREQDLSQRAAEASARYETLKETVGAAIQELQNRLQAAERALFALQRDDRDAVKRRDTLMQAVGALDSRLEEAERTLHRNTETRLEAVDSFVRLVEAQVVGQAAPRVMLERPPWSVTRAVEAARQVEDQIGDVSSDDVAWDRSNKSIYARFESLKSGLSAYEYRPQGVPEAEVLVVTVPFQGRMLSVAELAEAIGGEVEQRQSLLSAREREVIENHLIGDVSGSLHQMLHKAEEWVRDMNRELEQRPTSTGMKLRFKWEPREDGPPDLDPVRKRLMRLRETWSLEDRQMVGAFLQRRIEEARSAQDGPWITHLTVALDYRLWHQFTIERFQDGQWKRLTRRTHGTGSGGEKVIALTIPQFAAAAAYYRTADPAAPRLILLDEAFVGVDQDMRTKCMGLLESFDLDFMMTSEREWGCYESLKGLAIYHLSTRPGIDAIGITRWVWNGHERVRVHERAAQAEEPKVLVEQLDFGGVV